MFYKTISTIFSIYKLNRMMFVEFFALDIICISLNDALGVKLQCHLNQKKVLLSFLLLLSIYMWLCNQEII